LSEGEVPVEVLELVGDLREVLHVSRLLGGRSFLEQGVLPFQESGGIQVVLGLGGPHLQVQDGALGVLEGRFGRDGAETSDGGEVW
jgi:hypothetical protein